MATFSERIKELRKSRHFSQRELAEKLGMSKSSIAMYESGKRKPDFVALETIADYFNVDMDYLTGRKDTTHRYVETAPCKQPDYTIHVKSSDKDVVELIMELDDDKKDTIARLARYLKGE